jgi:hypothetical protein
MRIRSILPAFWESEDVAAMPWDTRLVFIGLWSYVDDNGAGRDIEKLIVSDLFPLEDDPRETLATVSRALQHLTAHGQIVRYTVDDKHYLYVVKWDLYQRIDRPGKERYPLPTCEDAEIRVVVATPSRQSRDTLATGEGEKGRRGEGEKGELLPSPATPSRTSEPNGFLDFYAMYPRKVGRDAARKAYVSATKRATSAEILVGAHRYAIDPNLPEAQYIPHPSKWLNDGRWADGPCVPRQKERSLDPQADLLRSEMARAVKNDEARTNNLFQIGAA